MSRSLEPYDYFWKSGGYLLHKYKEGGEIVDHCLIYDMVEDCHVKIEDMNDYTLGDDIKRRMEAEGVPVVRALPPEAFFLEQVRMELFGAGVRYEHFNRAIGELAEMKKAGCSHDDVRRRMRQIIEDHSRIR